MDSREKVKEMISQKDQIEKEIKELYDVLASQGNVGMTEPLVDREGYPRSDVDVYQIRISRNRISCLQSDHKNLMKEIENELHGIHTQYKAEQPPVPTVDIAIQDASQSFATINLVSDGSPAETATSLQVKVKRGGKALRVMLIPKRWNGQGLLGCKILPL